MSGDKRDSKNSRINLEEAVPPLVKASVKAIQFPG